MLEVLGGREGEGEREVGREHWFHQWLLVVVDRTVCVFLLMCGLVLMFVWLCFIQHHAVFGDDLTAAALQTCKKTVLHPYLLFLKMVRP